MRTIALTAVGIAAASLVVVCVVLAVAVPDPIPQSRDRQPTLEAVILDAASVVERDIDELKRRQDAVKSTFDGGVLTGRISHATAEAVRTRFARMVADDDLTTVVEDFSVLGTIRPESGRTRKNGHVFGQRSRRNLRSCWPHGARSSIRDPTDCRSWKNC